jgi:hydrogenase large subunit
MTKLYAVQNLLKEVADFVQQVYVPDVIAIGSQYPEWLGYGAGVTNYLAVPDLPLDARRRSSTCPAASSRTATWPACGP